MFSTLPVNFGRIEAMMRSGSRSNSPEHELRQMTSSSPQLLSAQISSHVEVERKKNKELHLEEHKEEHSKQVQWHFQKVNEHQENDLHNTTKTSFLISENSRIADSNKQSLSSSLSELLTSETDKNTTPWMESSERVNSVETVELNDARKGVKTWKSMNINDDRIELTQLDENVVIPCVWHYGSILYYPVTCRFYCWNGHQLELRLENALNSEAGVSCDFCGYTLWNQDLNGTDKNINKEHAKEMAKELPIKLENTALECQHAKKGTNDCHSHSPSSQQSSLSTSTSSSVRFYHCATCALDFCNLCIRDIANNVRFHVPCMQCQRCGEFVAIHTSAIHRCKLQRKRTLCKCADEHRLKEQKKDNHVTTIITTVSSIVAKHEEISKNNSEICKSEDKTVKSNIQSTVEQQYMKRLWENSKPLSRKLQKRKAVSQ